ncbi:substrate-binding domain-containing protein [Nitratireductor alexandrii]|uniref:substrate-binding domain-containing protein n=1 Tax=Nitratireductor alexandrii TaxID=2448161 RepID=UPI0013DF6ECD|nr:substrate-binding domain-containing protein [Nitratireductor alexandrii]
MRAGSSDMIAQSLIELIDAADDGARLPTVRELMARHGVGQATVQEAFARLRALGLISSQVGRGSFVVKPHGRAASRPAVAAPARRVGLRSLLILANSSMNERCSLVQNRIVEVVGADGGKVVQMSYHDTDHLLDILKSIPTFDAVILQSHYEVIPVRLLAMLQSKTRALVVDGHTVSGVDIDRMGIDWEEALDHALDHLTGLGHRRITLVSLDSSAQPILGGRRYFARMSRWRGQEIDGRLVVLEGMKHPTQGVASALEKALARLRADETQSMPTALIFIGFSDCMGIREVMRDMRIDIPGELSIVILGHPDVATEHLGLFTMVGGTHEDGAEALIEIMKARIEDPGQPPQIVYLDCRMHVRDSTGPARTD